MITMMLKYAVDWIITMSHNKFENFLTYSWPLEGSWVHTCILHTCKYIWGYVWGYMYTDAHLPMWSPEVDIECVPQSLSHFLIKTRSLTVPGGHCFASLHSRLP